MACGGMWCESNKHWWNGGGGGKGGEGGCLFNRTRIETKYVKVGSFLQQLV